MVSCGSEHTAISTHAKQLFVMGSNEHGQLGLGGQVSSTQIHRCTVPTLVHSLVQVQVLNVDCGARHTLAVCKEIIGSR